jgi:hypothetical protein
MGADGGTAATSHKHLSRAHCELRIGANARGVGRLV